MNALAAGNRAYELIAEGQPAEALKLTAPFADRAGVPHLVRAAHAAALKALGRETDALAVEERTTRLFPASTVAWHNYAVSLDAVGRSDDAAQAIDTAFALGADTPESWLVKARIAVNRMANDEAVAAYEGALIRDPAHAEAAQELARLRWMMGADWRAAAAPLRAVRTAGSDDLAVVLTEGKILEAAGQREELHRLFSTALRKRPNDAGLVRAAAHACLEDGDLPQASALAERTVSLDPTYVPGLIEFAAVRLAQGRADEAFEAARRATQVDPLDQSTWGWLATAGRGAGHPIFEALHDYDNLVRSYVIATPPGWATLTDYLADLETTLDDLHRSSVHPADQSLRHGTQTTVDLLRSDKPALRAFFTALEAPIRAYMHEVGAGADPLRSRVTGEYMIQSAWSVLLRPNGFHVSHYHPMGWISSAFYVRTPAEALETDAHDGWIKFGEPPFKTVPAQPAKHFVKPEPGKLVLFPSYMWHSTVPFTTDERRMTIAFDVLPV
jgi:uncharacterized protein (TIGR02466 family)